MGRREFFSYTLDEFPLYFVETPAGEIRGSVYIYGEALIDYAAGDPSDWRLESITIDATKVSRSYSLGSICAVQTRSETTVTLDAKHPITALVSEVLSSRHYCDALEETLRDADAEITREYEPA